MASSPTDGKTLADLEAVLRRIPGAGHLLDDVRELRALLVDRRPPRVAVIGRRGSGKSSIANALLGANVLPTGAVEDTTREAGWSMLESNGRRIRWLDTPGLRAGGADDRTERVFAALVKEPPDVVLFTCRATQVDAGFDEDATVVKALLQRLTEKSVLVPAVLGVVTRVDELPPIEHARAPFEGEKLNAIENAVAEMKKHAERMHVTLKDVVPVASYMRGLSDGTIVADHRWQIDKLAEVIFGVLPMDAQADAARAFEASAAIRRRASLRLVRAAAGLAFLIGATPWLPLADLALLTPLQTAMITGVMYLGGARAQKRDAVAWIAGLGVNVGAGYVMREAARALFRLLGPGDILSGAIAAGGTWAIGVSAIKYFVDGASASEAKEAFERARRRGMPKADEDPGLDEPPKSATVTQTDNAPPK